MIRNRASARRIDRRLTDCNLAPSSRRRRGIEGLNSPRSPRDTASRDDDAYAPRVRRIGAIVSTSPLAARAAHAQDASSTPPSSVPSRRRRVSPSRADPSVGHRRRPGSGWIVGRRRTLHALCARRDPSAGGWGRAGWDTRSGRPSRSTRATTISRSSAGPRPERRAAGHDARRSLRAAVFILPFAEVRIGPAFDATSAWVSPPPWRSGSRCHRAPAQHRPHARDWLRAGSDSLHSILTYS